METIHVKDAFMSQAIGKPSTFCGETVNNNEVVAISADSALASVKDTKSLYTVCKKCMKRINELSLQH